MPKVIIVDYTGFGMGPEYAARILAFTKSTRLNLSPDTMDDFMNRKPWNEIEEELKYMVSTLPSSWEFVSMNFLVSEASRACAQQITRTRDASYAMQAQRVVDVRKAGYHVPERLNEEEARSFRATADKHIADYASMIDRGFKAEDARELLPIGIHCNLLVRHNLRSLTDLVSKRQSLRVQSEYRSIVDQMKSETLRIWPWSKPFFENKHDIALKMLEEVAEANPDLRIKIAKAVDLIRTNG